MGDEQFYYDGDLMRTQDPLCQILKCHIIQHDNQDAMRTVYSIVSIELICQHLNLQESNKEEQYYKKEVVSLIICEVEKKSNDERQ